MSKIFNDLEYGIFGILFSSELEGQEQPEVINMPDVESEESAAQRQQGQGIIKILHSNELLTRLLILLAPKKQVIIHKNLKIKQNKLFIP